MEQTTRGGGEGSRWWAIDAEYFVAFGPMTGYTVRERYDFARWLPPGRGQIVVLHRERSFAEWPLHLDFPRLVSSKIQYPLSHSA